MAVRASELRDWINTIPPHWHIGIDDGGLTLVARAEPGAKYEVTLEVGGETEPEQKDNE